MRDPSAWSVIGGWLLAVALILVIYGGWALVVRKFKTPTPTRPAAQLPRVGVGAKGQCENTGCGYLASMWVIVADRFGGGVRHLCVGCHNEGVKFGWWRISLGANPTPFDFELADDLDRLEQLANEGGVA
jgi:hypothetical protein